MLLKLPANLSLIVLPWSLGALAENQAEVPGDFPLRIQLQEESEPEKPSSNPPAHLLSRLILF